MTEVAATLPPMGNTGASVTAALHWVRGTSFADVDSVLATVAGMLQESVIVLESGGRGYSDGWLCGPVRISANEERPEMGVKVDISGEGCEVLGHDVLARLVGALQLRVSRVDVAFDGCNFTPALVRDEWRADRVRSKVKVQANAREDRPWRTSDWRSNAEGDTFYMGARDSAQFMRVYDRRGSTRLELEIKHDLAHAVGAELILASPDPSRFRALALSLVRRFVDFVDPTTSANRSRCTLLPWWAEFVGRAAKARVSLPGRPIRTAPEIDAWVEHAVAPALAVIEHVYGSDRVEEIVRKGRQRWTGRHRVAARVGSTSTVPVTA